MVSAESYPGFVLLGIAVLFSLRLFYRAHADDPQDALHVTLTVAGRTMIAVGFMEAVLLFLSFFGILLAVVGCVVLVVSLLRYRALRRASLLTVMATATRKWMPLTPAVAAFAGEWRGGFGYRVQGLANLLAQGVPLGDALRRVGGLASGRALALIDVGTQTGTLSGALDAAARLYAPREAPNKALAALAYFLFLGLTGTGILIFVMLRIVPELIKIFEDFYAELPGMTLALIDVSEFVVNNPLAWIPLGLLTPLVAGYIVLRYLGAITWDPPLIDRLTRRLEMSALLRMFAVVVEAGRPMEIAIASLAQRWPRYSVRSRLRRVLADMQVGGDWCESMRQHGLLTVTDAALLQSAARVGNLAWAMRETAAGTERKISYHVAAWLQVAFPVVVLFFGGVVLLIVVGLFIPLVALIEKLV